MLLFVKKTESKTLLYCAQFETTKDGALVFRILQTRKDSGELRGNKKATELLKGMTQRRKG